MKKILFFLTMVLTSLIVSSCGQEELSVENYSNEPVTYLLPFGAGGQSDIEARRQMPFLEEKLDTDITINYQDGAGGAIAWSTHVREDSSERLITGINIPHIILQPMTRNDTGYETDQINPIALFQGTPIGLAVHKDSDIETLEEFIEEANGDNNMTVSGAGTYSGHHLAFMQLVSIEGLDMEYIPSTGASEALQNFLGGNTDAILTNSNDLLAYKDEIKILAMGSEERFDQLPDIPTFQEEGVDLTARIDRGVAVPPGTDEAVVQMLEEAFLEISNDDSVQEKMKKEGFEPIAMGREETEKYIDELTVEFEQVMRELGEIE